MDIREKVYERLLPVRSQPRFHLSVRWAAMVALVMILSAGAAYALWPPRPTPDPGLEAAQAENLIVQINETKTLTFYEPVRKLDVTVDYAYADSNRIAVGYHINGVADAGTGAEIWFNPTLKDAERHQKFLWLFNNQVEKEYATDGDATDGDETDGDETFTITGLTHFNSSPITDTPKTLTLDFQLEFAFSTAEMREREPNTALGLGVANFRFTVPYNPGRTIVAEQTAEASNLTITIQNVVIAPSVTRVEFCVNDPQPLSVDKWLWETSVSLDVDDQTLFTDLPVTVIAIDATEEGIMADPNPACRALTIPEALTDQSGTWTITLNGFSNFESGQTIPGVWTFVFDVEE